jgi:hypothetical protein
MSESEQDQPHRGSITVVYPDHEDEPDGGDPGDLFEQEEHPIRVMLAVIEREDAPDLVAALEAEGIGARLGEPTEEDGVEVLVHDTNLAAAQAILVEFTGDPSLVDDVEVEGAEPTADEEEAGGGDEDPLVVVTAAPLPDLGAQAERLAEAGIDVRMEVPGGPHSDPRMTGKIWVDRYVLERARSVLGIER